MSLSGTITAAAASCCPHLLSCADIATERRCGDEARDRGRRISHGREVQVRALNHLQLATSSRCSSGTPCRNRSEPTVIYHSDRLWCLLAPGARGCAATAASGCSPSYPKPPKSRLRGQRIRSRETSIESNEPPPEGNNHTRWSRTSLTMAAGCTKGGPARCPSRAATFARRRSPAHRTAKQ
jgi:hypothetical protein